MREYMAQRRERRRTAARELLGGVCVVCGSAEGLDFDHVDAGTKSFDISTGLDKPWPVILAELAKCQLLCRPHHVEKSRSDPFPSAVRACCGRTFIGKAYAGHRRWCQLTRQESNLQPLD